MDITAIDTAPTMRGPSTLLRLQGDERLVTLTRRGNQAAYEVLVQRYQARLLAFCRHMLGSREDAEDVLQEVFANAFNAINGDDRKINVRPWLYRIARNRCLNHLRKVQPIGVDTLDDRMADNGISAEETAHRRQEFRELLGDVRALAETQRTALLLREIDALSYEQIAEAMDTTVPSVKSLLVRARVGLAEASEARNLTCEEVREELGEASESLKRLSPPIRRHVKDCERCAAFQTYLKANNRTLTAIMPIGPLVIAKKLLAHLTAGFGASGGAAAGAVAASSVTGGVLTTGVTAVASKTAAGLAAAAIVTAGAVEVDSARTRYSAEDGAKSTIRAAAPVQAPAVRVAAAAPAAPVAAATTPPAPSSERSGGLTTTATSEKQDDEDESTTTTTTRSTTTTEATEPTTTTAPSTAQVVAAAPPTTTTAAAPPPPPPPPPVDTKEQNVTLPPEPTTPTPPAPKPPTKPTPPPPAPTTPKPPPTGTTTPTDVPPPTPTPGSSGELPTTPLVPAP